MLVYFKPLVTSFLLPPGLFIGFLLLYALFEGGFGNAKRLKYLLPCIVLFWLCSIGPFADRIVAPLEQAYSIPDRPQADVIVLFTGGIQDYAPDMSGVGAPAANTMERLVTAARLHNRLQVPILVSGGRVFKTNAVISQLTRRFLLDLGIPADQIMVEEQSRDTYENALYSKLLCEKRGFTAPLLVTSASHMPRAMFCCDKAGFRVTPFPCAFTTWPNKQYGPFAWLPSSGALKVTSTAAHEWVGRLFYVLKYHGVP